MKVAEKIAREAVNKFNYKALNIAPEGSPTLECLYQIILQAIEKYELAIVASFRHNQGHASKKRKESQGGECEHPGTKERPAVSRNAEKVRQKESAPAGSGNSA